MVVFQTQLLQVAVFSCTSVESLARTKLKLIHTSIPPNEHPVEGPQLFLVRKKFSFWSYSTVQHF